VAPENGFPRAPTLRGGPHSRRIVVISPHLDDAILSLGAAIHRAALRGASVDVLTVFAGDVGSPCCAGDWDSASGFTMAGEAAAARRREDLSACRALGARPVWLSFGDEQYPRGGDALEILAAITGQIAGAELVLVPGFPLHHQDHDWLARTLAGVDLGAEAVAAYVEQPYACLAGETPPDGDEWAALAAPPPSIRMKQDACRTYRSQLPVLPQGMLSDIADYELRRGGEAIRYLSGSVASFTATVAEVWPGQAAPDIATATAR
jgi:LmbE family N-acetylglucosaminyl deacetylase